jgi:hypothetical protein
MRIKLMSFEFNGKIQTGLLLAKYSLINPQIKNNFYAISSHWKVYPAFASGYSILHDGYIQRKKDELFKKDI